MLWLQKVALSEFRIIDSDLVLFLSSPQEEQFYHTTPYLQKDNKQNPDVNQPTLTYATPVMDTNNQKLGMIVTVAFAQKLYVWIDICVWAEHI